MAQADTHSRLGMASPGQSGVGLDSVEICNRGCISCYVRLVTVVTQHDQARDRHDPEWVLLSYRVPRQPSTPRITIWRKLKDLGVAQIGDGLVALPNNPRNKEQLEWIAGAVDEADGEAIVWEATPVGRRYSRSLKDDLSAARTNEYQELLDEVSTQASLGPATKRAVNRWRRQWRRIDRRDYFRAPLRDEARLAIADAAKEINLGEVVK